MNNPLFTLTPPAVAYYQKKLPADHCLKISSKSGCSGKKIEIDFVPPEKVSACEILEQNDIKIFYDTKDTEFLKDLSIDYVKNLVGGTIQYNKPDAENVCGCGQSWK
jgi:iron-sulfur cluster assembly accessory protein